jgi:hypothetical protein
MNTHNDVSDGEMSPEIIEELEQKFCERLAALEAKYDKEIERSKNLCRNYFGDFNVQLLKLEVMIEELQQEQRQEQNSKSPFKFIKQFSQADFDRIVKLRVELWDNGTGYRGKRKLRAKMSVWLGDTKPLNGHILPMIFTPFEPVKERPGFFFATLHWSGRNRLYSGTVQGTVEIKNHALLYDETNSRIWFAFNKNYIGLNQTLPVSSHQNAPTIKWEVTR